MQPLCFCNFFAMAETSKKIPQKYIVKQHKSKMHKDTEEMEALCQSAVGDGGLGQMFTDQVIIHRIENSAGREITKEAIVAECRA